MLKETLQSIQNLKKEEQIQYWMKFALTEVMPKIAEITKQPDFGYHGLEHTEQVVLFGIEYALSENINPLPVILAAGLHDCARTHDSADSEHAFNAVPIAHNFLAEYDFGLSEDEKTHIIKAIKGHTHGENSQEKIAACLWDADRTRLAWEYKYAQENKFSTKRGLEVAKYNSDQQKEYINHQTKLLEEIGVPSYLLMQQRGAPPFLPKQHTQEEQMQKWTEFIINHVMPIVAPKGRVSSSIYNFENSSSHPHGNFSDQRLAQTEQVALLGADYALSKGVSPIPVIWGCVIKDLHEKYSNKNKWVNNKREPKTQEDFIQDAQNFLDNPQLNLTEEDKKNIINAVFFAKETGHTDISSCIQKAFKKQELWHNSKSSAKQTYLTQQLNRLNKTDMPSYIQQQMVQKYTYENSPTVGTKENPIIFYHSTHLDIAKLEPRMWNGTKKLYVSPDIRYILLHITGNKTTQNRTAQTFISINNSGLIDRNLYVSYLNHEKHMTEQEIKEHLNKNISQSIQKEVDTPSFVYKGELVGIFPLSNKSFKDQGIDLPMERICQFMKIDYPIKDKKLFLKQTVKSMEEFKTIGSYETGIHHHIQDLKKLEDFLKHVDISDGKSTLQENTREPYVQMAEQMIKTFIERQTPQNLTYLIRQGLNKNITHLIDGVKECGFLTDSKNPPHYVIFNPGAIRVTNRYKLNECNIIGVEKANTEGHFGALTVTPSKTPQRTQLTPELLARNIHKYL